ncbi:MAG: SCO family protein [Pseudonocardiaceae bacterium]
MSLAQSEQLIEELVTDVLADPARRDELVALLHEDHPAHAGRGAGATGRVRGWLLAAFADVGLPDAALPFIGEELQTGDEPVVIAGAARALQGHPADPAFTEPLLTALRSTAGRDDTVSLTELRPTWPIAEPTTALTEILAALRMHGAGSGAALAAARQDLAPLLAQTVLADLDRTVTHLETASPCCTKPTTTGTDGRTPSTHPLPHDVIVEDQDGEQFVLTQFLSQAPTLLAFFYTRCANPRKCSLTITSLGVLATELAARGESHAMQIAAVTYDPAYDTPTRLHRYGRDRGLPFGPTVRMLRAVSGDHLLRDHLALRVGYSASIVTRHGIELFLLNTAGRVTRTWARQRWTPQDILEALDLNTGGGSGSPDG